MTIRADRGRLVVEFQFRGQRVFRRLPQNATRKDAEAIEQRLRRKIFEHFDIYGRDLNRPEDAAPRRGSDHQWGRVAGILLTAHPVMPRPGVYFLCNKGRLVYIGMSKNVAGRLAGHVARDIEFDTVSMVDVPAADLRMMEAFLIRMLKPAGNKQATGRVKRAEVLPQSFECGTMAGIPLHQDA